MRGALLWAPSFPTRAMVRHALFYKCHSETYQGAGVVLDSAVLWIDSFVIKAVVPSLLMKLPKQMLKRT